MLVSQSTRLVQIYRRRQDWARESFTQGSITFDCLAYDLPLEVIYEDVPLT